MQVKGRRMPRWVYAMVSLVMLVLVSGCGGSGGGDDTGDTGGNQSQDDSSWNTSLPLEDVAVDTVSDSADFTVVRPGLAYTCAVWQSERPHTVSSTSKVLVSPVGLPPEVPEATINGGFQIDEAQWMDDGHGVLLKGSASCDIASVQDAAGKDYLVVAYDEMEQRNGIPFPTRAGKYVVLPLQETGVPEDATSWHYHNLTDVNIGLTIPWASYGFPQVKVGVTGTGINFLYVSDNGTAFDGSHVLNYNYFASVEEAIQANAATYHEVPPVYADWHGGGALCPLGSHLPGSLDAKAINGFEVSAVFGPAYAESCTGEYGLVRYRFEGGVLAETRGFSTLGIYGYTQWMAVQRTDADYLDERSSGGYIKFLAQGSLNTRNRLHAVTGDGRFISTTAPDDVYFQQELTGISSWNSMLVDGDGNLVQSTEWLGSGINDGNFVWDAVPYNGKMYALFRNPVDEPTTPMLSLLDVDFSYDGRFDIWPSPPFLTHLEKEDLNAHGSYLDYVEAMGYPRQYHPAAAASYAVPDLADFRQRTECYKDSLNIYIERDIDLDCNQLLKAELYQQTEVSKEQLLILYPNTEFKLRMNLVDMPD